MICTFNYENVSFNLDDEEESVVRRIKNVASKRRAPGDCFGIRWTGVHVGSRGPRTGDSCIIRGRRVPLCVDTCDSRLRLDPKGYAMLPINNLFFLLINKHTGSVSDTCFLFSSFTLLLSSSNHILFAEQVIFIRQFASIGEASRSN